MKGWRIKMSNMPKVKIGIVAVSRDCFPESLSVNRRKAVVEAYTKKYGDADIYECPVCIVESEIQMVEALEDIKKAGCNALAVYLGNFGPEIAETLLAKHFEGPKMFFAAAEERGDNLLDGRGDAYCGMLNASYNLKLRGVKAYIPEYPVGNAEECAEMLHEFVPIAGKCWPAFQTQFGFVPCYVNSRLTAQGIPVSCEVDIYGALSEFIGTVVSEDTVTLLDINNTVPHDLYEEDIKGSYDYTQKDTFMGFHCGNTAAEKLSFCEMKYQKIMARSLPIEVTQGTLEGDIKPGDITFFRLQSTADCKLRAYIAQGEVLPVATRSFGAIGIFAIPEMGRFYRHVLIEKNFPHHGAVAFGNFGKTLYEVFKYVGVPVEEIGYNQPAGVRYPTENPWG